jgi:hypothetical protein
MLEFWLLRCSKSGTEGSRRVGKPSNPATRFLFHDPDTDVAVAFEDVDSHLMLMALELQVDASRSHSQSPQSYFGKKRGERGCENTTSDSAPRTVTPSID